MAPASEALPLQPGPLPQRDRCVARAEGTIVVRLALLKYTRKSKMEAKHMAMFSEKSTLPVHSIWGSI